MDICTRHPETYTFHTHQWELGPEHYHRVVYCTVCDEPIDESCDICE